MRVSIPHGFPVWEARLLLLGKGLLLSQAAWVWGGRTLFLQGSLTARRLRYFSRYNPLVGGSVESPLLSAYVLLDLCTPVHILSCPPRAGKDAQAVQS